MKDDEYKKKVKPEKQEGWREELNSLVENNLWAWVCPDCDGGGANGDRTCKTCKGRGVYKWETDLLLDKISQLLSERRKETLEEIYQKFFPLKVEGWEVAGKTYEHPIKIWLEEEISKLSRQE
jgi:hypothetical protein